MEGGDGGRDAEVWRCGEERTAEGVDMRPDGMGEYRANRIGMKSRYWGKNTR